MAPGVCEMFTKEIQLCLNSLLDTNSNIEES